MMDVRVSSLVVMKDVRDRVVPMAEVARAARENTATAVPATGPCEEISSATGSTETPSVNGTRPRHTASNATNIPSGIADPRRTADRIRVLSNPR